MNKYAILGSLALAACTNSSNQLCRASQPTPIISDVAFHWDTHKRDAPGSDNWPITWSDDDHQYTAWGDGGGFGGANRDGRVSLGIARLEGGREAYSGYNVWGGFEPESPPAFGGKSYGLISIDGVLYAWWGPGTGSVRFNQPEDADRPDGKERWNGRTIYDETRLIVSYDKGRTWARSGWTLTDIDDRLIMPTILNFGKDNDGARDEYVYHYFIRNDPVGPGLGIHKGGSPATGKIDLARIPAASMMKAEEFEFFAGTDECGNAVWGSDAAIRQPVFEDPNGVGWTVSATYNAGIDRYILITEHGATATGRMGMFEAEEPWGPWHTIVYFDSPAFGAGSIEENTFHWNISNKWTRNDGKEFVLVFSGVDSNDSWNSVEGSFELIPGNLRGKDLDVDH